MGMDIITPPSSPPVSFLNFWTISVLQRIKERGRFNKDKTHEMQLKLKYGKMNSNRQQ
jgi:hypothetical protein